MEKNTKNRIVYNNIMKNKTSKKISLLSLMLGYLSSALFIALIFFNIKSDELKIHQASSEQKKDFIDKNSTKIIYVDRFVGGEINTLPKNWNDSNLIDLPNDKADVFVNDGVHKSVRIDNNYEHLHLEREAQGSVFIGNTSHEKGIKRVQKSRGRTVIEDDVDAGLLDRRLAAVDYDKALTTIEDRDHDLIALGLDRDSNNQIDVGNFVPDTRHGNFGDEELGAVGNFGKNGLKDVFLGQKCPKAVT